MYRAHDRLLDRPVALKVLFPELSIDRSFVERFRREAQAAANLSHPNIVPVFDWGEDSGTYFIVMEFIDGRPLSRHPQVGRAAVGRPHRRHRRPRGRRPRLRPQARRHPPGRQTGQRADHRRGSGEGHRLRHRPGHQHRGEPHPDRGGDGHRHLLLARAGRGHRRRRPERHLLARRRPVRDGDRPAPVPRGHPGGGGVQARPRPPPAPRELNPSIPADLRGHHLEGHGQGPGPPLRHGRGAACRPAPLQRGPDRAGHGRRHRPAGRGRGHPGRRERCGPTDATQSVAATAGGPPRRGGPGRGGHQPTGPGPTPSSWPS